MGPIKTANSMLENSSRQTNGWRHCGFTPKNGLMGLKTLNKLNNIIIQVLYTHSACFEEALSEHWA